MATSGGLQALIDEYRRGGDRGDVMRDGWDTLDREDDGDLPDAFLMALYSPRDEPNPSWATTERIGTEEGYNVEVVDLAYKFFDGGLLSSLFVMDTTFWLLLGCCDGGEVIQANFYEFDRSSEFEARAPNTAHIDTITEGVTVDPHFAPKRVLDWFSGTGPAEEVACQFVDFLLETLRPTKNDTEIDVVAWSNGVLVEDTESWEFYCYNGFQDVRGAALAEDKARKFFTDIIYRQFNNIYAELDGFVDYSPNDQYGTHLTEIGVFTRARNMGVRGPHAILWALVDARRAHPQQPLNTFLYTSPQGIFRHVLGFL